MDKISSQKDSIQQSLVLQPYILSFDHQDRYYKDLFSEIPNYLGKTLLTVLTFIEKMIRNQEFYEI